MTSPASGGLALGELEPFGVPPFDGDPYLVTRIGRPLGDCDARATAGAAAKRSPRRAL